jgi:hypothetical protein
MNLDEARHELDHALAATDATPPQRFRAAQRILIAHGAAAVNVQPHAAPSLTGIIKAHLDQPNVPARRDFALLLIHALREPAAVRAKANAAQFDRDLCVFLESALLNPLRRAGYPFSASTYDKLRCLERLHGSIEEHMRPLEPTFPPWLSGLPEHRNT